MSLKILNQPHILENNKIIPNICRWLKSEKGCYIFGNSESKSIFIIFLYVFVQQEITIISYILLNLLTQSRLAYLRNRFIATDIYFNE